MWTTKSILTRFKIDIPDLYNIFIEGQHHLNSDKEMEYMNVSKSKKDLLDQIESTKIFLKKNEELKKKKKISIDSFIELKKSFFDILKNILIDEVEFVQNEYQNLKDEVEKSKNELEEKNRRFKSYLKTKHTKKV